jgi:hypothetical protein
MKVKVEWKVDREMATTQEVTGIHIYRETTRSSKIQQDGKTAVQKQRMGGRN